MTNTTTPKAASLLPQADQYLDGGFNVLLYGPHGTGKTQTIKDIADARGLKWKYFSCSTLDPYTDLVGVPVPMFHCYDCNLTYDHGHGPVCANGHIMSKTLEMVRPREIDEAELIFFDEFNRADSKTLNAIFEIIQFRSINGEPLPNLKACWAAMNPPEEGYQVDDIDPALMDRFDAYIEIEARPSVQYMAQFVPEAIAIALKRWWDNHDTSLKKQKGAAAPKARMDYISPRRLLKIGQIWVATENVKAVKCAIPVGAKVDTGALIELLRAAQGKLTNNTGPAGLGDMAADFDYTPGGIFREKDRIIEYLEANPQAHETHENLVKALSNGAGGSSLVEIYAEVLNLIQPALVETMISSLAEAKVSQMRMAFKKLHKLDNARAKQLTSLHKILSVGARGTDWPATL